MKLCVSFFDEHDPHLIAMSSTEQRTAERDAREQIVNGDLNPFSVLAKLNPIDTFLVLC